MNNLHYEYDGLSSEVFKQRLIVMREVPRAMLYEDIGASSCTRKGEFDFLDIKCRGCDLAEECLEIIGRLEYLNDESNINTILRNIFIARDYMLHKLGKNEHSQVGCHCKICNWLNELDALFSERYEG